MRGFMVAATLGLHLGLAGTWEVAKALREDQASVYATPQRRELVRELVADLVSGAQPADDEARRRAQDANLDLNIEEDHLTLSAPSGADGLIVIRRAECPPLVLQAPHAFYDTDTGAIAGAMFDEGAGKVVMFNTVHRPRGGGLDEGEPADLAHRSDTVFQAATIGAAQGLGGGLVVQLHGFADRPEQPDLAIVASQGANLQSPDLLARAILELAPFGRVLGGEELPELAARTNAQSKALTGSARFLHLELSASVRRGLRASAEQRAQLRAILEGLL